MPANSRARNQNKSLRRLPDTLPTETRCIKVYIPDNIEYVGYLLGAIGRLSQQVFYDRDEAHTAKLVADLWKTANQQTMGSLADGCDSNIGITDEPPTYFYDPPHTGNLGGIEIKDNCIVIDESECFMPIYVNGCGCGCGCGSGNQPQTNQDWNDPAIEGGILGIGAAIGAYGDLITEPQNAPPLQASGTSDCDWVTGGGIDYMLDQQKEMLLLIDGASDNVESLIGLFASAVNTLTLGTVTPEGVKWLASITAEQANNAAELWIDTDFREAVKIAWLKAFPVGVNVARVTRESLFKMTSNLKRIWLINQYPIEARTLMQSLIMVTDMNKLNQRLTMWEGECDSNDYEYFKANAGQYWQPPISLASVTAPIYYPSGDYDVWMDFRTVNPYPSKVGFPDNNAQWFSGEGVGSVPNNDNKEGYAQISHTMGATLNGYVVYLTAPLQGDQNYVMAGSTQWGDEYEIKTDPSGTIHVFNFDALVVSSVLHTTVREWTNQAGDQTLTARIAGVRYIGNGTPPVNTVTYNGELEP